MKYLNTIVKIVLILLLVGCDEDDPMAPDEEGKEEGHEFGILRDIDGNEYQTVKIGEQWWMAENLKVTRYRNGEDIPNVTDNSEWGKLSSGAWVNYNNDSSNDETYGKLYNWYAVNDPRGLCPVGWHVPFDVEWKYIEMYLGISQEEANDTGWRGTDEGGKLKSKRTTPDPRPRWNNPNTGATNESGFSGLPGGWRSDNGNFYNAGNSGYWWSAMEYSTYSAWYRNLGYNRSDIKRSSHGRKEFGYSIRCVKDYD